MLKYDLTQDFDVFLANILETPCQELTKNLAKSSQDLVGIYTQLSIILLKKDLTRSCRRSYIDLKVFLTKILETSCQELTNILARSSQDLIGIYVQVSQSQKDWG